MERFGATRDGWIARDLPGWLAANGIYAGLSEVLQQLRAAHELYIVTTKQVLLLLLILVASLLSSCFIIKLHAQARFTEALLHNAANLPLPPERIFSTAETGQPKSEVLLQLHARHPSAECHFVEDKLSTLEKVMPVTSCCNACSALLCSALLCSFFCPSSVLTPVPQPDRWPRYLSLRTGTCTLWIGVTTRRQSGPVQQHPPG